MSERWVCLDIGDTLVDERRIWSIWADELGVRRLTFLAALGAVIERATAVRRRNGAQRTLLFGLVTCGVPCTS